MKRKFSKEEEELFMQLEKKYGNIIDEQNEITVFNRQKWNQIAELGIIGGLFDKEYGGQGWKLDFFAEVMKMLGEKCGDIGLLFSLSAHILACMTSINRFGTEQQKQLYLPQMISGELIAAIAIAEEQGASDAFAMETIASKTAGGYILNGEKCYITNAPICDVVLIFAKNCNSNDIICLLVDRNTKGIEFSDSIEKMGLISSPFGKIAFKNCFVEEKKRLGTEKSGKMVFFNSMEWERGMILAPTLGIMKQQIERCIAYLSNRESKDKKLLENQVLRHRIVDMQLRLDICEMILNNFINEKHQGMFAIKESIMSKLYISEAFAQNSFEAMQLLGAKGYTKQEKLGQQMMDALGFSIASGTSDIQREMLAKIMRI